MGNGEGAASSPGVACARRANEHGAKLPLRGAGKSRESGMGSREWWGALHRSGFPAPGWPFVAREAQVRRAQQGGAALRRPRVGRDMGCERRNPLHSMRPACCIGAWSDRRSCSSFPCAAGEGGRQAGRGRAAQPRCSGLLPLVGRSKVEPHCTVRGWGVTWAASGATRCACCALRAALVAGYGFVALYAQTNTARSCLRAVPEKAGNGEWRKKRLRHSLLPLVRASCPGRTGSCRRGRA